LLIPIPLGGNEFDKCSRGITGRVGMALSGGIRPGRGGGPLKLEGSSINDGMALRGGGPFKVNGGRKLKGGGRGNDCVVTCMIGVGSSARVEFPSLRPAVNSELFKYIGLILELGGADEGSPRANGRMSVGGGPDIGPRINSGFV